MVRDPGSSLGQHRFLGVRRRGHGPGRSPRHERRAPGIRRASHPGCDGRRDARQGGRLRRCGGGCVDGVGACPRPHRPASDSGARGGRSSSDSTPRCQGPRTVRPPSGPRRPCRLLIFEASSSKWILDNDGPITLTRTQILGQKDIRTRRVGGVDNKSIPKRDAVPTLVVECGDDGIGVVDHALPSEVVLDELSGRANGDRDRGLARDDRVEFLKDCVLMTPDRVSHSCSTRVRAASCRLPASRSWA